MKNKPKIEFFLSQQEKDEFKALCKKHSYKMSEILRRAIEEKLEWLRNK